MNALIQDLQERGLISQSTDLQALSDLLDQEKIALYCGFDPTADSLHIGHLLPIITLMRFQFYGHKPIALIGGATGMIGDPSFKATERSLNSVETVNEWVGKIQTQLQGISQTVRESSESISNFVLKSENANDEEKAKARQSLEVLKKFQLKVVNNQDWFGNMNCLAFLRDIGKHFSVNQMLAKDSVKQRIEREEQGISYTEFSYALLQGYDFAQLYQQYGVKLQIGGSDQWGNITWGTETTRRLHGASVHALTLPLITKADGTKFGKTEGGTIWLDKTKTSPYKFYQFWLSVADADVYKFLKYFTLYTLNEIDEIEKGDKDLDQPSAQVRLAVAMTAMIHGIEAYASARRITESLFSDKVDDLTEEDFQQLALDGLPVFEVSGKSWNVVDALIKTDLAESKKQAREFVKNGAVALNGKRVVSNNADFAPERPDDAYMITEQDKRFGRFTLIKRGKKLHALLIWKD